MFDSNRRKYPRANYPCQLTMWCVDQINETIMANTSNLGSGGVSVYLNQPLRTGTKVDVRLSFNDSTTPFKCQGTVVRCTEESPKIYSIGIQFEPLSEIKQSFIDGKVSELIALEKKEKS